MKLLTISKFGNMLLTKKLPIKKVKLESGFSDYIFFEFTNNDDILITLIL